MSCRRHIVDARVVEKLGIYFGEHLTNLKRSAPLSPGPNFDLNGIMQFFAISNRSVHDMASKSMLLGEDTLGHWAVRFNDPDRLDILCSMYGFDIFTKNQNQHTVLDTAILCKHDHMIPSILILVARYTCKQSTLTIEQKMMRIITFVRESMLKLMIMLDSTLCNVVRNTIITACAVNGIALNKHDLYSKLFYFY